MLKEQISGAALDVLIRDGLEKWTVSAVADQAGCAKGLVHYHHKTKEQLLGTAADQLARATAEDRLGALGTGGNRSSGCSVDGPRCRCLLWPHQGLAQLAGPFQ